VSIAHAAELKMEYAARFDNLPLQHRRTLMRSLLDVRVDPGRGVDRVRIKHLAAPSLDQGFDHEGP